MENNDSGNNDNDNNIAFEHRTMYYLALSAFSFLPRTVYYYYYYSPELAHIK